MFAELQDKRHHVRTKTKSIISHHCCDLRPLKNKNFNCPYVTLFSIAAMKENTITFILVSGPGSSQNFGSVIHD